MYLQFLVAVAFFLSLDKTVSTFFTEDFDKRSYENPVPCEDGWYYFDKKCYKVEGHVSSPRWWTLAKRNCLKLGGNLVSIHSKHENDFILTLLTSLNIRIGAFIGLYIPRNETAFEWQDESSFNYNNWAPGQPDNNQLKEKCAEIYIRPEKAGLWNDVECYRDYPYICQKASNESLSTPDLLFCPSEKGGGLRFRDSCYHIVNEKRSWDDAEKHCQSIYNGHLVKIMDIAHDKFLDYILLKSREFRWIGLKIQDKQQPRWSAGYPLIYDHLDKPLEDIESNQCILRWKQTIWTSNSCQNEYPFICEISKVKIPYLIPPAEEYSCPKSHPGWIDLGGPVCYYFDMKSRLTWFDALNECIKKDGILVSIHSSEEEKTLQHFIKSYPEIFIGLNSLLTGGNIFIWSDGRRMNYTHWGKKEPSTKSEMCVELRTNDMSWNDVLCTDKRRFICQADKVPISPDENEEEDNERYEMKKGGTSYSTLYIYIIGVILVLMLGISVYIARKWLKKKMELLPTIKFRKFESMEKLSN